MSTNLCTNFSFPFVGLPSFSPSFIAFIFQRWFAYNSSYKMGTHCYILMISRHFEYFFFHPFPPYLLFFSFHKRFSSKPSLKLAAENFFMDFYSWGNISIMLRKTGRGSYLKIISLNGSNNLKFFSLFGFKFQY